MLQGGQDGQTAGEDSQPPWIPPGAGLGVPAQPARGTQLGWGSTGGAAGSGGAEDDPGSSAGTGFGFYSPIKPQGPF